MVALGRTPTRHLTIFSLILLLISLASPLIAYPTPPIPAQPDLTFSSHLQVIGDHTTGHQLLLKATIINKGSDTALTINTTITINNNHTNLTHTGGLNHDKTYDIIYPWTPLSAGTVNITFFVNSNHHVPESNGTNNNLTTTTTIYTTTLPWWNTSWHYRINCTASGTGNHTTPFNFTALLHQLDITNRTFEDKNITVIQYTTTGNTIAKYHFTKAFGYNAITNAAGNLTWDVSSTGTYAVYFDVTGNKGTRHDNSNQTWQATGTPTVSSFTAPQTWWSIPQPLTHNSYKPHQNISVYIKTTAKTTVKGVLLNHSGQKNLTFNSTDQVNWTTTLKLAVGNYTIITKANDTTGYTDERHYQVLVTDPDLAITFKQLSQNIPEKQTVTISVTITAYAGNFTNIEYTISNNNTQIADIIPVTIFQDKTFTKDTTWTPTQPMSNTKIIVEMPNLPDGNASNNEKSQTISIIKAPDLGVVNITLPSTTINQGDDCTIQTTISNSGHDKGKNFTVSLYLEQHGMHYTTPNATTIITLDAGKTTTLTLNWTSTGYGDPTYLGRWYVGIRVYNTTHPDPNPSNDNKTTYTDGRTITVISADRTLPTITITPPTDPERGRPITLAAYITDPAGLHSVTITVTWPNKTSINNKPMNTTDNVTFTYIVKDTTQLGIYPYTITAVDNSINHNTNKQTQSFLIEIDHKPPTLNYTGASRSVQLPGDPIEFTCRTWDFSGIKSVTLDITTPQSTSITLAMPLTSGDYYAVNHSFDTIGMYTFVITSEDNYNNTQHSTTASFWITNDLNDTDSDGMPDAWEIKYSLDPYNPADANQDPDHDGYTNLQEYQMGIDPLHAPAPASALQTLKDHADYLAASTGCFAIILILNFLLVRRRRP